MSTSKIYG